MNETRLAAAGTRRAKTADDADRAHRAALDAVLAELDAAIDRGERPNVKRAAELAGVSRQTVYNELARRQERRDQLSPNGAPAAAPHDDDRERAPTVGTPRP